MFHGISRPSPALMIAVLALFVALGGSAVAAGIVPPAQHAYTANSATVAGNARHLGGKTAAQIHHRHLRRRSAGGERRL